jgi:hypothetical protein
MKPQIKLWLDDIRNPEKFDKSGWVWVKNYHDAIAAFQQFDVIQASLDHDLSITYPNDTELTGYDVVCWMEKYMVFPINGVHIHSSNPVGARRMADGLKVICHNLGYTESLVTVWPADMDRLPRPGEDPYNIMW